MTETELGWVAGQAWASDLPHGATDCPYERKVVDHLFYGVPDPEAEAILDGNVPGFLS